MRDGGDPGCLRMILEERTRVEAPPDEIFRFFTHVDRYYEDWHPDHLLFRWVEGDGLKAGNQAYFEERIGGELKQQTVQYTRVDTDRYIEFRPTQLLTRLVIPHMSSTIEPDVDGCRVVQRIKVRTGPIGARLNRREFDAVRKHMQEEGENLKRIVEQTG